MICRSGLIGIWAVLLWFSLSWLPQLALAEETGSRTFDRVDKNNDGIIGFCERRPLQQPEAAEEVAMPARWEKKKGRKRSRKNRSRHKKSELRAVNPAQEALEPVKSEAASPWQAWWKRDADINADGIVSSRENELWRTGDTSQAQDDGIFSHFEWFAEQTIEE